MKSQLTFSPEVLTCGTLYNHCDYFLTVLVIYERLNILKNNLALMAMYSDNLHTTLPDEDWPPLRAWVRSRVLPRFRPFEGVYPSHRASTSALLAFWGFRLGFCTSTL